MSEETMPSGTVVPGQGVQLMTVEEVNDYLEGLLKGKLAVEGLEADALARFQEISGTVDRTISALGRAEAQVVQFKAEVQSANGELKAYANILACAEDARRVKKIHDEALEAEAEAASVPTEQEGTDGEVAAGANGNGAETTEPSTTGEEKTKPEPAEAAAV